MITGKNMIGNKLSAKGSKSYQTFNPQLNEANSDQFIEATAIEIYEAVALAKSAFATFQLKSGQEKAAFLEAIADEIMELDEELVNTYCSETGLPEGRARGERGRTVGQLRTFAQLVKEGSWVEATIDHADPDRTPIPKSDIRKMLIPLGPVVVFGASNFPLAYSTAGGDTAAALAAGCPVIVKSHPMHAGTGELVSGAIIKAAQKTNMPEGVFSNLNSSGIEVGVALVSHPGVKAVGFTGSINGGRALYDLATKREEPIPVFAEMGSVNPVVILPDALTNRQAELAQTYAKSVSLGAGQFCTNPGLILGIKGEGLSQFASNLATEIEKIEPTCMLGPNILNAYDNLNKKATQYSETQVLTKESISVKPNYANHIVATVKGTDFLENKNLHHEVFGPYSLVVQCDDQEQLVKVISNLEGQLTGTIISDHNEISDYNPVISALQNRVGRLIFNGVPTGVEVCAAMNHGGPYPASTDSRFTAVGIHSIKRWVRPMSFQDWPNALLPEELKEENPLGIGRLVDGEHV